MNLPAGKAGNKFTTYFLYGIGEIILVVIGILIAVQIDNWNTVEQRKAKEVQYLHEIRTNLQEDILNANSTISFDSTKIQQIKEVLKLFGSGKTETEILMNLPPYLGTLLSFQLLSHSSVAFDNMVSAESVGIVSNSKLRSELSIYYSDTFVSEERTKELTRQFGDLVVPIAMNSEFLKSTLGLDLVIEKPKGEIAFYKNPLVIASLVNILKNLELQIGYATNLKTNAEMLVSMIDDEIAD